MIETLLVAFLQKSSLVLLFVFIIFVVGNYFYKSSKLKIISRILLGLVIVSIIFWIIIGQLPFCDSWIVPTHQESSCQCRGVKINYAEGEGLGLLGGLWGNKCLGETINFVNK